MIAALVSAFLVLTAMVGLAGSAQADSGIDVTYTHGGATYDGVAVFEPNVEYVVKISYGRVGDGHVATLNVPAGVTIPDSALVVPAGNTAITALTRQADGSIAITFADPFPASVEMGLIDLKFLVTEVSQSTETDFVWSVDGSTTSIPAIVKVPGDEFENLTPSVNKSAGWVDWSHVNSDWSVTQHVSVVDGQVVIDPAALTKEIPYTIAVNATTAGPVAISDTLGAGLTLVPGSFAATLTTWDANGLNKTKAPADAPTATGTSFSHTVTLPAPAQYELTYKAKIADAAALEALRVQLQAEYEKVAEDGGAFTVGLTNTAVIGGVEKQASTAIGGSAAAPIAPDTNVAFGKSTPTPSLAVEVVDGELTAPAPVTYTLKADLTQWDSSTPLHTLAQDVIVSDILPSQATWIAGGITVVDAAGVEHELTLVTGGKPAVAAAGPFSYSLEGGALHLNLGRDAVAYTVTAKAEVASVANLWSTQIPTGTTYLLQNKATFDYGKTVEKTADVTLIAPKDTSGGVDDPGKFKKTGPAQTIVVNSGETLAVPYTFVIGVGVTDLNTAVITDVIDHNTFDVSDLAAIKASIKATGHWYVPLTGDHFEVTLDADDNLRIMLNDAGRAALANAGDQNRLELNLTLTTLPVEGKQTLEINNSAILSGEGSDVDYISSTTSKGTSFGSELEVRKTVYDAARDAYTSNLRVELAADGSLVQDEFIYRVKLIPHGGYFGVAIRQIADALPDGVDFVGFVSPAEVASGVVTPGTTENLKGNLVASWDEATRTVSINNAAGTVLTKQDEIDLFFKVRIAEFIPQVGIKNVICGTDATITPTNDYPLDIAKLDSSADPKVITDRNARFTVTNADGVVVSNAYVVDGKLRVAGADGTDEALRVTEPGTYEVRETTAPAGYEATDRVYTVTVGENGSSTSLRIYNAPGDPVEPEVPGRVSVGNYVWFDENNDGLQDETDEPLEGVTLTVLGPDGEPVTVDADGKPYVSTTMTDAAGHYLFENLPVLTEGQTYTVVVTAPEGYEPTTSLNDGTDEKDSSTDRAVSQLDLTVDGASDLTLDFGFVKKPVDPTDPPTTDEPTDPTDPPTTDEPTDPTDPPTTDEPVDPTDPPTTDEPVDPTDPPTTDETTDEPVDPKKSTDPSSPAATTPSDTKKSTDSTTSAPAPAGGKLVSTGASPWTAVGLGMALVLGGLGALIVRRRMAA